MITLPVVSVVKVSSVTLSRSRGTAEVLTADEASSTSKEDAVVGANCVSCKPLLKLEAVVWLGVVNCVLGRSDDVVLVGTSVLDRSAVVEVDGTRLLESSAVVEL